MNAKVSELRRQEGMDPPVPAHVIDILDAADGDLRLLNFKYAALATAAGKRAAVDPGNDRAERETGVEGVNALTEADLNTLLAEHVSPPKRSFDALNCTECTSTVIWQHNVKYWYDYHTSRVASAGVMGNYEK